MNLSSIYLTTVVRLLNTYSVLKKLEYDSKDPEIKYMCSNDTSYISFLLKMYLLLFEQDFTISELSNLLGFRTNTLMSILLYLPEKVWNKQKTEYETIVINRFNETDMLLINHILKVKNFIGYKKRYNGSQIFRAIRSYVVSRTNFSEQDFLLPREEKNLLSIRLNEFEQNKKQELQLMLTA